ncbi:protein translocase subunit SecD [Paracoccus sp. SCSIO 75233]|uniref:protein translocase subunit SecD n=1 Tax=Paracoccus sp. SCSIO 75233 TaxID=3017782 RepID=UPI0022F0A9FF|nr:protein translocase subunit SecD [Paracoccus sp. SCSIO 75233]WBU53686.1 protein translocase subunit SecD [Paracoccus sp. SCSIO 75233]
MLDIPLWKRVLILGVVVIGLIWAMPNMFYGRVEAHNDAVAAAEKAGFATEEQEAAIDLWPDWLPSGLVNLGLDLRGGAHLLAEVHVEDVYKSRMDSLWPELRRALAEEREVIGAVRRVEGPEDQLHVEIENPDQMARAVEIARGLASPIVTLSGAGQSDLDITASGNTLIVQLSDAEKAATDTRTIQQSLEIVRRRVDEVGTREPTIQRQGSDRILIQVPGIGSAAELKELIGTTAQLTFNPVIGRGTDPDARAGIGNIVLPSQNEEGVYYTVEEAPVVTGEELTDASPSFDQNGQPAVDFRFNPSGARKFGAYTAENIGQPFAIVLDNEVISAPVIRDAITTGSGQISGSMDVAESTQLAVLLRAGALPAELTFLEERTIGPELGQDSIDAGKLASIVAIVGVVAYVVASYGIFGVFASVAVIMNVVLLLALMSAIGATLTLPGIAGIVLTVGTAVDANVIIFERIREELRKGKRVVSAVDTGFREAMSAIIDANVTTFIAGLVMFFLGSGPVKGFAVTLTIGLATSVFTAIYFTRLLIVVWLERRRPKELVL